MLLFIIISYSILFCIISFWFFKKQVQYGIHRYIFTYKCAKPFKEVLYISHDSSYNENVFFRELKQIFLFPGTEVIGKGKKQACKPRERHCCLSGSRNNPL